MRTCCWTGSRRTGRSRNCSQTSAPETNPFPDLPDFAIDRDAAVRRVARSIIERYADGDADGLTEAAFTAWSQHPDILLDAMYMWFQFSVHHRGEQYVNRVIAQMTRDIADADVDEPATRSVFCDLMWAMLDKSQIRAMAAWMPVHERNEWDVACEVISLVLSYVGHFIGAPSAQPEGN